MGKISIAAVLTALITSAFWIWFFSAVPSTQPDVARTGNVMSVQAPNVAPVVISQQVVVGPAGLAIPVQGVAASQLIDTYSQARAEGPHLHFAINRLAPNERWWNGSPINPYPLLAGK